jgi:hypothetical protein
LGTASGTTGTGSLVLNTSPTLATPALGTPSSGDLTNCTFPSSLEITSNKETSALDTSTTKYPCNNVVKTAVDAKQNLASSRYSKGNISGAVTIDYSNGDFQVCTTTATVTGITISNLATETGMILLIDNSSGYSVTFGSTEIIAAADTGVYACAFYNDNGTIYFMGKGERQN